jgi:ADP-ribose pyrophosphatase YjhB (NUDIX family)
MKDNQLIGTCALLFNQHGQVLLGKRKNSYKAGYYGLPGGRVEVNEPLSEAIVREVKEETGLEISNLKYLGVIRENQGDYDFIHFVYMAQNVTNDPVLCEPEKCAGWEWFDLDAVGESILPGHLAAMHLYMSGQVLADITNS